MGTSRVAGMLLLAGATIGLGAGSPRPAHGQFLRTAGRALDRVPNPFYLVDDYEHQWYNNLRTRRDEARLQADLARGDAAAVNYDLRRLQHDQAWGEHVRWEAQRDSLHLNIGPDPIYAYRDQARAGLVTPAQPLGPRVIPAVVPASAKLPITIARAGPVGAGVPFTIDGAPHTAASGPPQRLEVGPTAEITYNSGGTLGSPRYSLSAGAYEFRPTAAGWALYKLPDAPTTPGISPPPR